MKVICAAYNTDVFFLNNFFFLCVILNDVQRCIQGVRREHAYPVGLRQNSQISLFFTNLKLISSFNTSKHGILDTLVMCD